MTTKQKLERIRPQQWLQRPAAPLTTVLQAIYESATHGGVCRAGWHGTPAGLNEWLCDTLADHNFAFEQFGSIVDVTGDYWGIRVYCTKK